MANTAFKILIVDDDKNVTAALAEVVKRMGYKPLVVNKAADALNLVRLQTVHAAIVDVLLPKTTGVDLVSEFRKTKFADNPVIFISGVFKDRAFASDTIKKSGATGFLFKPFDAKELMETLTQSLQSMINAERWTLQSFLTREFESDRERMKAIERLDEIRGADIPFFLSFLLGMESSGHLNMVTQAGEIYGLSLAGGAISDIDGPESLTSSIVNLISQGFLSQEDWDAYQTQADNRLNLDKLIEVGLVSPHAVSAIRHEQVIADFRTLCASEKIKVNFSVHENAGTLPKHAVNFSDILGLCMVSAEEFFSLEYLADFYAPVKSSAMYLTVDQETWEQTWRLNLFSHLEELKTQVESKGTLEAAIASSPSDEAEMYICLNHLVISRVLVFQDLSKERHSSQMLERLQKLHKELEGRTADKIFEYFGASGNASQAAIQTIYDEYLKANNPESPGSDVSPEVRELSRKCFELVKNAYEVMTNDEKRAELKVNIKSKQAEKQTRSQALMNQGVEALRRGQAPEALALLLEAEQLFASNLVMIIRTWAEIKAGLGGNKARLSEIAKQIESVTGDDRKSIYFYMAQGLIKKEQGDMQSAMAYFERAFNTDDSFAEAKRELRALQNRMAEKTAAGQKKDIFNADITSVFSNVTNIFRRKAD